MISHVFVGVRDFDRALVFYRALMPVLGIRERFCERERPWAGWQSDPGPRPLFLIGTPHDGQPHGIGNGQMVAFLAADRDTVDRAHAVALAEGGRDEGAPALRPEYHEHYYGAYFRDTEGNKLCVACHVPVLDIPRDDPRRDEPTTLDPSDLEDLVDRYCAAWSDPDPARRATLIAGVWSEGATYTDPGVNDLDRDALLAHITRIQHSRPGAVVRRTSAIDAHHGMLRFAFEVRAVDGSILRHGTDVVLLDGSGRLGRVIGFFGDVAMPDTSLLLELQALESELHHPGVCCSRERLDQLLHPAFHEVGRSGRRYDRDTVIEILAAVTTPRDVVPTDHAVTRLATDCALLTYRSALRGEDGRLGQWSLRSSIWRRTGDRWQLYYHQGTPEAGEP